MSDWSPETQSRWMMLPPEKFIQVVINGALRDQIRLTYTFVAVNTQISTAALRLPVNPHYMEKLRDLLKFIRENTADINNIISGDAPTVPPSALTPVGYIRYIVNMLRLVLEQIDQSARIIQEDENLKGILMPNVANRRAGSVAADIRDYLGSIIRLIDFIVAYCDQHTPPR